MPTSNTKPAVATAAKRCSTLWPFPPFGFKLCHIIYIWRLHRGTQLIQIPVLFKSQADVIFRQTDEQNGIWVKRKEAIIVKWIKIHISLLQFRCFGCCCWCYNPVPQTTWHITWIFLCYFFFLFIQIHMLLLNWK